MGDGGEGGGGDKVRYFDAQLSGKEEAQCRSDDATTPSMLLMLLAFPPSLPPQFTSLPPTVLMDDDKDAAPGVDGKPGSGSGGGASPGGGTAATASGRASFVGRAESVSGGLFHGFTYESPTMMSYLARTSNAADLSRGSRAGSLAILPGFSFAEAPGGPGTGSMRRSGSALFQHQPVYATAAAAAAPPPHAERGISQEIAAGMDAARRPLAQPSGLAQALASGGSPAAPPRSGPSGLAAALAANGSVHAAARA